MLPPIEHYPSDLDLDRLLFAIEKGESLFDSKVFGRSLEFLKEANIVMLVEKYDEPEITVVFEFYKPPTISFIAPFRVFRDQTNVLDEDPYSWANYLESLWDAAALIGKRILTMERRVMRTGAARGTTDSTH